MRCELIWKSYVLISIYTIQQFTIYYNNALNALILQFTRHIKMNGQRRYKYLVVGRNRSYFAKIKHSDSTKKFSETDIINMLEFLIDNIFVIFGGRVFQQTRIPFGKVEVITTQIMYGRHHDLVDRYGISVQMITNMFNLS